MPSLIRCLSSTIAGRQNRQTRPTGWRKQQGRSAAAQLGCPQKPRGAASPQPAGGVPSQPPAPRVAKKHPAEAPYTTVLDLHQASSTRLPREVSGNYSRRPAGAVLLAQGGEKPHSPTGQELTRCSHCVLPRARGCTAPRSAST